MALIKCTECGREISSKSSSCPGCGAPVKAKSSVQRTFLGLFALMFVVWLVTPQSKEKTLTESNQPPSSSKTERTSETQAEFKTGDSISVGYMGYQVQYVHWQEQLTENQFVKTPPNANYLVVKLNVVNTDNKARMISPYHLIDENGVEYDTTSQQAYLSDAFPTIENLNPGVVRTGSIAFDVPRAHKYKLKLPGGYWSNDFALVDLGLTSSGFKTADQISREISLDYPSPTPAAH